MMDVKRININLNGLPTPPLADSEKIKELEKKIKLKLPRDYRQFLQIHDGGHPEIGSVIIDQNELTNIFDVDWFYSIANSKIKSIFEAIEQWKPVLGNEALPFAQDGGGNQFYLNLKSNEETVWLLLHDQNNKTIKIADNFAAFISLLQDNPDFI
ncbi:SMI1/KNR4 family protein [Duganella sp. CF517]|uniref:SMI1/KNR4 family protein n=1 Tax=Duganella sp. CF517 TaxID=1881038 RepID=UPI000B7D4ECD|nr:SMI1/KNR4 family protein [Duganella sp. CF517]